jgi:hypothetical protein
MNYAADERSNKVFTENADSEINSYNTELEYLPLTMVNPVPGNAKASVFDLRMHKGGA